MGLNISDVLKELSNTPRGQIRGMTAKKWFEFADGRLSCNLGECPNDLVTASQLADKILVQTVAKAVIREDAERDKQFFGGIFNEVRRPEVVDRIEGRKRSKERKV